MSDDFAYPKVPVELRPLFLGVLDAVTEALREPGHAAATPEAMLRNDIRRLDGVHVREGCPHYVAVPPTPVAPFLGRCHQTDGTWIHGRRNGEHTCPKWARG